MKRKHKIGLTILAGIFALLVASCRQETKVVIETTEVYHTRYIVMEFTGEHGPGDILLANGEWVLARDINKLTKERLDATPAVGILAFEKPSLDKTSPNTPVVIGLEIKRGVKFSTGYTNTPALQGNFRNFDLPSGSESGKVVKQQSDYSEENYPLFAFASNYSVVYNGVPTTDWYVPNIKELSYAFIGSSGIETSIKTLHELDPESYPTETLDCAASYRACNQETNKMAWFLTWSYDPNDIKPGPGSCRVAQKDWEHDNAGSGLVFCAMVMHDFSY